MDRPTIIDREMAYDRRNVHVMDGVRMSLVDHGPKDAEETVVFLHGNPTWSFLWRNLIGPTLGHGHRVVAPDMVGLGLSEKPLSPAYHSLERHVQNLESAFTQLDLEDITLVMHDWGGPIGMGFATRHQERIRRLIVANTVAFAPTRERSLSTWHSLLSSRLGRWLGVRMNLVAKSAFRLGVADPLDEEVKRAYMWPLQERGARIATSRLVEMVPDGPEHPSAETLRQMQEDYTKLQDVPMLVLWADSDPVMRPGFARKWGEAFPDADVRHVAKTAKHFWQEDDPGAFLKPMLAWIDETKD